MADVVATYRAVPPDGNPFLARIVDIGGGLAGVVSNRSGSWAPETMLTVADLVMPEQQFAEWDIKEIEASDKLAKRKKVQPSLVGYVDRSPRDDEQCSTCTMFVLPDTGKFLGSCTLVDVDANPRGWCRKYEAK